MKCQWCGKPSNSSYCCQECFDNCQPGMNELCPDKDTDKCLNCDKRRECLQENRNHRIKRSEIDVKPGESYTVDGIEYYKIPQACINCSNLGFHDSVFFCVANSSRGNKDKVKDLTKDQSDCEFWKFREGESLWEK